jgi:photosystem II stability/assembly factor-like uncharacterized protein
VTNNKNDRDATIDRLLAGTMTGAPAGRAGACLDADTLAAWADHALDAGGLAAVEAHAADCARCQAMLAAMVKTAPEPDAGVAWWRVPPLRWLIPLTAATAAVIVWAVAPMRRVAYPNVTEVTQSAESIPPRAPAAAADVPAPAAPDTSGSSPASALSRTDRGKDTARGEPKTLDQAKQGEATRKAKEADADKNAAAPLSSNAMADAPARSADARLEKAQAAAESRAPAAPAPPAARAFALGAAETVIVSSNPASRWRIVPGGAVQRSADGGATWQLQNTGVTETLSAGSSPSPSVCWLVGPNGIVLLSADGSTWKRVDLPEKVLLTAIRATDAQTATVTTADGREFVTEDGGRTWVRTP